MLDFDAYLRRIGLDPADKPTWQAVHRAHATTIPFENLDSHGGIPISLEQADSAGSAWSAACALGVSAGTPCARFHKPLPRKREVAVEA